MTADPFAVADWRRRTAEMYAIARSTADPGGRVAQVAPGARPVVPRSRPVAHRPRPARPLYRAPLLRLRSLRALCRGLRADLGRACDRGRPKRQRANRPATRGLAPAYGQEFTLYWVEGYGGGLFLSFADATTGAETHAGGRYILDGIKGADLGMEGDRIVLDFNFAFNPAVAYRASDLCPPPLDGNRLEAAVLAGEKMPD